MSNRSRTLQFSRDFHNATANSQRRLRLWRSPKTPIAPGRQPFLLFHNSPPIDLVPVSGSTYNPESCRRPRNPWSRFNA